MSALVERRTIAKGAAWSIPVIALAGAAPAASASTSCSFGLTVDVTKEQFKNGGTVAGTFVLTLVAGTCGADATIDTSLQVQFTLPSVYDYWYCNPADPNEGELFSGDDRTVTILTTAPFVRPDDQMTLAFSASSNNGSRPITFTVSAPAVTTTSFTVFQR